MAGPSRVRERLEVASFVYARPSCDTTDGSAHPLLPRVFGMSGSRFLPRTGDSLPFATIPLDLVSFMQFPEFLRMAADTDV
jgi:hypothetical protein